MSTEEMDLATYGLGATLREFVDQRIDERLSDDLMVKIDLKEMAKKIAPLIDKELGKAQERRNHIDGNSEDLTEKMNNLSKWLKPKETLDPDELIQKAVEEAKELNKNNVILTVDTDSLADSVAEKLKKKIDEIVIESMLGVMRVMPDER